ncbi:MAG: type-F conjugative transfer system protein TrbI [Citrobacter sp.]
MDTKVIPTAATSATDTETQPDTQKQPLARSRSKRRNRCILPVAIVAGTLLTLNAAISLLMIEWQKPVTVSFDMTNTVNQFMAQAASQPLSEAQSAQLAQRFNQALTESLTDYSQQHRAVIVVSQSVVAGAADITNDIQTRIAQRMQK